MALGSLGGCSLHPRGDPGVGRTLRLHLPYVVEVTRKTCPRVGRPETSRRATPQIASTSRASSTTCARCRAIRGRRQNWLKAYDFVTDEAAVTLNEYARDNDPFARVGRETVSVEVASVVRASESSFQVRWVERTFEGGALKDTKRLTGLFSLILTPPRTVEAVRKNPLGIYVHTFNWSQDVTTSTGDGK